MRTCCSQKKEYQWSGGQIMLPGEIKGTVWGKKQCIQLTWHCFLVKVTKDMGSRSPGYPAVFLSLTDPDIRSVIRSSLGKTWSGPSSDVIARHQQTFFLIQLFAKRNKWNVLAKGSSNLWHLDGVTNATKHKEAKKIFFRERALNEQP